VAASYCKATVGLGDSCFLFVIAPAGQASCGAVSENGKEWGTTLRRTLTILKMGAFKSNGREEQSFLG